MLRNTLLSLVVMLTLVTAALFFITRDTEVTHQALRATDLPELIPTRAFYADPRAAYDYIASPDGVYVAHIQAGITGEKRVVREVSSGKLIAEFPRLTWHVRWHPELPRLRFIHQSEDWEADIFNPDPSNWVGTSPVELSGGWRKYRIARTVEESVLTWGRPNLRSVAHMWLVSQDGLHAEKVAEGTEKTLFWIVDEDNRPELRVDTLDPGTRRVMVSRESGWEPLIDVNQQDTFIPVGAVDSDGKVLMLSGRGRDKTALVSFDVQTAAESVVLDNPDADIGRTFSLTPSQKADIIHMGGADIEYKALTEQGETFLNHLSEFEQPVSLDSVSPTASGRYVTAAISPAGKSFLYLLIDLQEKTHQVLGEYHFRRYKEALVGQRMVNFSARDGLSIPAVLSMPENPAGPIPFIVHIHGGPASHVDIEYDHASQFLVNRGYGVLSVNFRGSTGYGKQFKSAGYDEFGRKMQDDITDAANWLVEQKMADPDALVVMGMSYGGYSAALAMTREPGLFDAAIVEFPMLDPEFQSKHHPGFWREGLESWWQYFGNPDNEEDLAAMRAYSPLRRVEQIHGPLLILAGVRDQITSARQVREFEAAARQAGKEVTVHYFADGGHGLRHWRDKLKRARLIEDFLAVKAAGRSGGFELIEWISRFY